jgi:hypothetical protein
MLDTKRRLARPRQWPLASWPPKEQKVLARIDGAEIAVPELIRRVATLKEFRKLADPRRQVHKIVDHLVAVGLVADRFAPGQKGPVRHVSRRQQ